MKKLLAAALLAISLAASAQAVIVGFEAGYLTDSKELYTSARLGFEVKADTSLSHQLEVEVGYTKLSDSGVSLKLLPVTLNYRADFTGANKLGYYFGFGAGIARTSVSGFGLSDSDSALALQGFVGATFKTTEASSLFLGAKYLWIGDVTLLGFNDRLGDEVAITAGVKFKF